MFVDQVKITAKAGNGGNGAVSFHREKFVQNGGPDGGDGGNGGDIVLLADPNMHTLMDFRYKRKYTADNGENGAAALCRGKSAKDLIIKVPVGTTVRLVSDGRLVADMHEAGQEHILLKGGRGGWGNAHFATPTRQAPNFAKPGQKCEITEFELELKSIADVGLVGYPNVGKSTILSVVTAARPKIANYHFTTLAPNLGICRQYGTDFVMADIPGLVEGASEGVGLGIRFLRHVERTRTLLFVVDPWDPEGKEETDEERAQRVRQTIRILRQELRQYHPRLLEKPWQVAVNKCDRGIPFPAGMVPSCHFISTATGMGIPEMCHELRASILKVLEVPTPIDPEGIPEHLRPREDEVYEDDDEGPEVVYVEE